MRKSTKSPQRPQAGRGRIPRSLKPRSPDVDNGLYALAQEEDDDGSPPPTGGHRFGVAHTNGKANAGDAQKPDSTSLSAQANGHAAPHGVGTPPPNGPPPPGKAMARANPPEAKPRARKGASVGKPQPPDGHAAGPDVGGIPRDVDAGGDNWRGCPLQARAGEQRDRLMAVPEWARYVGGDGNEILVLAYLDYWLGYMDTNRVRTDAHGEGYDWVARSYRDIGRFVGLTERQVEHAVAKLVRKNLVVARAHFYRGQRMIHLRLRADAIAAAYESVQNHHTGEVDDELAC